MQCHNSCFGLASCGVHILEGRVKADVSYGVLKVLKVHNVINKQIQETNVRHRVMQILMLDMNVSTRQY